MAVIAEFSIPGATPEQVYEVEQRNAQRAVELGRAPYDGMLFLAVTPEGDGFRAVTAWRTEGDFRTVLDTMLGPDLTSLGLAAADVRVTPVVSMAIPG
jgi:hypothetical protein